MAFPPPVRLRPRRCARLKCEAGDATFRLVFYFTFGTVSSIAPPCARTVEAAELTAHEFGGQPRVLLPLVDDEKHLLPVRAHRMRLVSAC